MAPSTIRIKAARLTIVGMAVAAGLYPALLSLPEPMGPLAPAVHAQDQGNGAASGDRKQRRKDREANDGAAGTPTAGTPAAAVDMDCIDFTTREEAQAVLDADPSDPYNLDPNGDGVACGLLPTQAELAAGGDSASQTAGSDQTGNGNRRRNRDVETPTSEQPATCDTLSQEEAQAILDADPSDPQGLDPNGNGIACESSELGDGGGGGSGNRRANRDRATPAPAVSAPPEDLDCINFTFQDEAQLVLNDEPSDPYNLDPNGDGFACTSLPSRSVTVSAVPSTGSGTTSFGIPAAAGLLLASAAFAVRRSRA